ncbi:MAG: hypothetical protein RLY20_390 [Verrucomicrobiota bacterium]
MPAGTSPMVKTRQFMTVGRFPRVAGRLSCVTVAQTTFAGRLTVVKARQSMLAGKVPMVVGRLTAVAGRDSTVAGNSPDSGGEGAEVVEP